MNSLKTNIGKALNISAELENRIIHDFNNGGCKTTYGLNTRQRKILIGILFSEMPKCNCINCIIENEEYITASDLFDQDDLLIP